MSTIAINGTEYDSVTGLPLDKPSETALRSATSDTHDQPTTVHGHSSKLHARHSRSETLNRSVVLKTKHKVIQHKKSVSNAYSIDQHEHVYRFAPHPAGILKQRKVMDVTAPAKTPPIVAKAHDSLEVKSEQHAPRPQSSVEKKNEALRQAIERTEVPSYTKQRTIRPHQKIVAFMSASLAVVIMAMYFAYLNMPALSVRVAAAQAGINAGFPEYRPTGYSLNGPVTFSSGKVAINFKANGGPQVFSITQSKSAWNSDAVLDNVVVPRAGGNYIPYTERGLTIYTFDNNAAWVNGGILYTLEGDAPLSSEQIRRIATSLL